MEKPQYFDEVSLVHDELESVEVLLELLLPLLPPILISLPCEDVLCLRRAAGLIGAQNAPSRNRSVKYEKTGSGGGKSLCPPEKKLASVKFMKHISVINFCRDL